MRAFLLTRTSWAYIRLAPYVERTHFKDSKISIVVYTTTSLLDLWPKALCASLVFVLRYTTTNEGKSVQEQENDIKPTLIVGCFGELIGIRYEVPKINTRHFVAIQVEKPKRTGFELGQWSNEKRQRSRQKAKEDIG